VSAAVFGFPARLQRKGGKEWLGSLDLLVASSPDLKPKIAGLMKNPEKNTA
jgi:hypothetical protein